MALFSYAQYLHDYDIRLALQLQWRNVGGIEYHIVTNPNTALVVRRIKDDLIDTLVFRNKYEIAISDILILPVCFLKVKPKVNKKDEDKRGPLSLLISFQMDTQYLPIVIATCESFEDLQKILKSKIILKLHTL